MENFLNKSIKLFKKILSLWKIIISIIFTLIIPLIITLCLYSEIKLGDCSGKKIIITSTEISKVSTRSIFADVLQIPLNLKWYDIHISAKDTNCKIPAEIYISFIEGNPEKYSISSLIKPPFYGTFSVQPTEDSFKMPENGEGRFTYLATDFFSIGPIVSGCDKPAVGIEEVKKLPGSFGFVCEIYAKPYTPAQIAQYLVTVIIFLFIFSSFLAVLGFVKRRKKI